MTTQNCAECGTRAEPGQSFCDACGAVLSWTDRTPARAGTGAGTASSAGTAPSAGAGTGSGSAGAPAASSAGTAPSAGAGTGSGSAGAPAASSASAPAPGAERPDPAAASRTTSSTAPSAAPQTSARARDEDRASEPPAADDHRTEDDGDDEDTTETPLPALPPTTATAADDDGTAPTTPAPALGDTMAARARSLLVPVVEPEEPAPAAPPSVAPVLPGVPVADRPQVRAPGPVQGEENGVACPWCATPNRPDRHYCTRCAMPMTLEDRSSVRLPWWRRLFGRGETPWAGDRPRLRRTFDRIVTWVMAAVVLTLLIVAGVNAPAAVQATKDHFAKRAAVSPDTFAASRSYPGHKPDLAFDKINNSWWGPGVSQSGEGEWIEARFSEPTRLLDLMITSGTSTRPDQLTESALPHRVKATITLKDGTTTTRELVLDQQAGGQRRAFRVGEVTKVRFTIESAYGASASKQVAIAEIEFFGPSHANAS
ncbi:zinc ribbon domain-containing protein [Streptomyces sp. NPDC000345]|uniref:NADase-type glycan-binding domain-containing protein n=1 Tax=Streptomyces sp. NPDC000345 TaxID=3364537 RepID=UPI003696197A